MAGVPVIGDITGANQGAAATAAANAQGHAAMRAREDLAPWMASGKRGLARFEAEQDQLTGPIDMTNWMTDPGYEFRREQGNVAIERAASRGRSPYGSAAVNSLTNFNQNLASAEFGNVYARKDSQRRFRHNSLFNWANMGLAAAGGQAEFATQGGNATAAGIMGAANARSQGVNNMLSLGMMGAGFAMGGPWGAAAAGAGSSNLNPVGGGGYNYYGGPR